MAAARPSNAAGDGTSGPPTRRQPVVEEQDERRSGGRPERQHLPEAIGTLLAALAWGVGTLVFFVLLGFGTHVVVELTVKRNGDTWRAAAGAVAAMFLVASLFALVLITGRGVSLLPRRARARRALRVQRTQARQRAAEAAAGATAMGEDARSDRRLDVDTAEIIMRDNENVRDNEKVRDNENDPTMPVPVTPAVSRPPVTEESRTE